MYKVITISVISIMVFSSMIFSQSVEGIWKTIDDEEKIEKSVVEIYVKEGKLYGKIIELLPGAEGTHCHECKDELKGAPLIGMQIIREMENKGDEWKEGYILDPAKGKEYRCILTLKDKNTLKVRGYIGTPMLGRTQLWYRK